MEPPSAQFLLEATEYLDPPFGLVLVNIGDAWAEPFLKSVWMALCSQNAKQSDMDARCSAIMGSGAAALLLFPKGVHKPTLKGQPRGDCRTPLC